MKCRDSVATAAREAHSRPTQQLAFWPRDVNGDGVLDLLQIWKEQGSSSLTLHLTTFLCDAAGAFVQGPDSAFENQSIDPAGFFPMDLDRSGLTAIVNKWVSGQQRLMFTAFRGSPSGTYRVLAPFDAGDASTTVANAKFLPCDVNGDGKADLLRTGLDANNQVVAVPYTSSGKTPDLLSSISNTLGAVVSIDYAALSDSSVYGPGDPLAFPAGAGRGWQGFRTVTHLARDTGLVTVDTYAQDFPCTGAKVSTRVEADGTYASDPRVPQDQPSRESFPFFSSTSIVSSAPYATTTAFDVLERPIRRTTHSGPDGTTDAVTTWFYGASGAVTLTRAAGSDAEYVEVQVHRYINGKDTIVSVTVEPDGANSTTQFTYDPVARLTSMTDPATAANPGGVSNTLTSDSLDRRKWLDNPDQNTTGDSAIKAMTFTYDAATGLQSGQLDAARAATAYTCDAYGNLQSNTLTLQGEPSAFTFTRAFDAQAARGEPDHPGRDDARAHLLVRPARHRDAGRRAHRLPAREVRCLAEGDRVGLRAGPAPRKRHRHELHVHPAGAGHRRGRQGRGRQGHRPVLPVRPAQPTADGDGQHRG